MTVQNEMRGKIQKATYHRELRSCLQGKYDCPPKCRKRGRQCGDASLPFRVCRGWLFVSDSKPRVSTSRLSRIRINYICAVGRLVELEFLFSDGGKRLLQAPGLPVLSVSVLKAVCSVWQLVAGIHPARPTAAGAAERAAVTLLYFTDGFSGPRAVCETNLVAPSHSLRSLTRGRWQAHECSHLSMEWSTSFKATACCPTLLCFAELRWGHAGKPGRSTAERNRG